MDGTSAAAAASTGAAAAEQPRLLPPYTTPEALDAHIQRAWDHFRSLGSPEWHVAPMVDHSELPFRMVCRRHGATAAYTPMLHARLFVQHKSYKAEHFTTCPEDRPLFVQFCANDPEILVKAALQVQDECDYVDLNLGCPQRIAKKGYYGAFLMDDLGLVERMVARAASALKVPVSCKIRLFPDPEKTLAYARMLERAGCSLLAVHGRLRDMKDLSAHRADWDAIRAVRAAVRIPVLANGDVRCLEDARRLKAHTGADGVMSAEPLLYYPALFDPSMQAPIMRREQGQQRPQGQEARQEEGAEAIDVKQQQQNGAQGAPEAAAADQRQQEQQQQQQQQNGAQGAPEAAAANKRQQEQQQQQQQQQQRADSGANASTSLAEDPAKVAHLERLRLCREYGQALAAHPVHPRMAKGHVHKLLQGWLAEFPDIREKVNRRACDTAASLQQLLDELEVLVAGTGRSYPVPKVCDRKLLQAQREAARQAAIEEQEREAAALAAVEARQQQEQPQQLQQEQGEPAAKRPCVAPQNELVPAMAG